MKNYFQAPWSKKDIVITMGSTTFIIIMAAIVLNYLKINVITALLIQWILIMTPLLLITKKYKFKLIHFGFEKISIKQLIKHVLFGYLLFIGITIIINILILYAGIKIPGYQMQEKILPLLVNNTKELIIAGISIVLIAPVIEEIFFRGFLLRSLSNKIGIFWGSILSAGIFSIFHLQLQNIIPIFILALIMNSLVIKSKSIITSIAFHIFNNAIAFTIEVLFLKEIIKIDEII
jgi:membrane protease YdiL (CAAX protease family)